MTIICINASFCIRCQIPVKSELSTVLQILLKLMIKVYHQKLSIMCYIHHLNFIFTSFFLWVYFHRCSSHWRGRTFDTQIIWLIQPRKKVLFGQIDFLTGSLEGDTNLMPGRGKEKRCSPGCPRTRVILTRIKSADPLNYT